MKNKTKIISIYLFLISFIISAQNNDINYILDFITTREGLSHNFVTSIISDSLNVKWIGTENGITKYNGYDFEYIKPFKEYKELNNENIEILFKDISNNIWIGTKSGGLSLLDVKKNTIKSYNHLLDGTNKIGLRVTALAQDSLGNIWVGTYSSGIFIIDFNNDKLLNHYKFNSVVHCIIKDQYNNMWYPINKNLLKYSPLGNKTTHYKLKSQITDLVSDSIRDRIWIGTTKSKGKIYFFKFKTQQIDSLETSVTSNFSKIFSLDNQNKLWIGTWGEGLYRSNKELTRFSKIKLIPNRSNKLELNYNTILDIHHDNKNLTWIATANGGVVKLVEPKGFQNMDKIIKPQLLNNDFNINCIYRDSSNIILGTSKNGVYIGNNFNNLKQIKEIGSEKIITTYKNKNKIFIGSSSGFYIYSLDRRKIIFSNNKIRKVTSFYIDKLNNVFIGTQHDGLVMVQYDKIKDQNAYTFYSKKLKGKYKLESNRITTIKEDQNGNIWLGTYNGLHLFDKEKLEFYNQASLLKETLPSIIINDISIKNNYIWLATPSGLFKLKYNKNKLILNKSLTKENGLKSDFICAVTFDQDSNIWISANTEIIKYNENKNTFISYGIVDGVRTTSFNSRSVFKDKNSIIYFGGIDNITFFNPKTISTFSSVPEIIFMNLRINNKKIRYNANSKEHSIIDKNFSYVNKITFDYRDKFFSIDLASNDFLGRNNINYRYKLEGYQDDWINIKNRKELNFTGLPAGNYILKAAATRDNHTWVESKKIDIKILESPWKSTWAYIIYVAILFIIITIITRAYNERIKLKNNLQLARIDREKEIKLNEAKLNFFTNISHEFRTPLTLIIGPLEELLEKKNLSPKIAKKLKLIDKNAHRLLNLISQLLDFRKADYGLLKLSVSNSNFASFSNEVYLYFKEAAESKKIKYKFNTSHNEIIFPFDRNKMEIVLCNLLSNAIKYCNNDDEINFKLSQDDNFCYVSVKDTGLGIDANNLNKVFDHFYQIKTSPVARMIGSGIGLTFSKRIIELHHGSIEVKSKKNIGTEFIIKVSKNPDLYQENFDSKYIDTSSIKAYDTKCQKKLNKALSINSKNKHSILIIDDNLEIRNYLKDILLENFNIILAENGIEGFKKASLEMPDLIISDIMMPDKDGISLCKELKEQIITSHIPIILLTAKSSIVSKIDGLKTGADDYITKPFNPNVIKARIASLLENRAKIKEHLLNEIRFEPILTEKDATPENAFIYKAIALVENNLQNHAFGIKTMVDELHMSQSTLYRKIKSLTGLSLTAFIRSIRLKKAARLILQKDMSLSQIAYEVGFNDYKYFKVSFKKQFNCLPSKYKGKNNYTNVKKL